MKESERPRAFSPSKEVASYLPLLRERRRYLHAHPEISAGEHRTAEWLACRVEELGLDEVSRCADTGIRAVLRVPGARRTVAFRADIDALSVEEMNDVDYRSRVSGVMHACGHDGHAALALTAAEMAVRLRDAGGLAVQLVFLFQPAEETIGGALRMCEAGALLDPDVDVIYGFHMAPDIPLGRVGLKAGPLMASTREVDVLLGGRAAHGAMPHLGADAVAAAAHFLSVLPDVIARRIDPIEPRLVTFGRIEAGTQRNVIPASARLEGIVRTFSDAVDGEIFTAMRAALAACEPLFGVTYAMEEQAYYPAVDNPADLAAEVAAILGDVAYPALPSLTAEDFAFYQRRIPGLFMYLGCGDALHDKPLHHNRFDFDETALLWGLELVRRIIA